MKNKMRKTIHVAQAWQLELSHAIHRGVCDYAKLHPDWEVHAFPLDRLKMTDVAHWESAGLIASLPLGRFEKLAGAAYPIISTYADETIPQTIPQVDEEHTQSGEMAADYLQGLGHKTFACISLNMASAQVSRARGFVGRLEENGLSSALLEIEHLSLASWEDSAKKWLHDLPKPVALFATNDVIARRVLTLCLDNHLTVPDEVAILGCENDRIQCEGITPAISSIELPYYRIGYEAARMLDEKMQGKKIHPAQVLFPPERVVARASTDTIASPDPHLRRAVQYIRDHRDEKIDLHAVAAHAGVSLRILQSRFQTELHRTPMEEIQRTKIERIKELLTSTHLSLDEIAEHTAFSTAYYLGRIFKRYTNQTPGQYRKNHRRF